MPKGASRRVGSGPLRTR
uniref:Uncharacterized protein n=1 Tax=Rhizophora mucronata TaxID=61149 RepID=A0A2P2R244_RHIMU